MGLKQKLNSLKSDKAEVFQHNCAKFVDSTFTSNGTCTLCYLLLKIGGFDSSWVMIHIN